MYEVKDNVVHFTFIHHIDQDFLIKESLAIELTVGVLTEKKIHAKRIHVKNVPLLNDAIQGNVYIYLDEPNAMMYSLIGSDYFRYHFTAAFERMSREIFWETISNLSSKK